MLTLIVNDGDVKPTTDPKDWQAFMPPVVADDTYCVAARSLAIRQGLRDLGWTEDPDAAIPPPALAHAGRLVTFHEVSYNNLNQPFFLMVYLQTGARTVEPIDYVIDDPSMTAEAVAEKIHNTHSFEPVLTPDQRDRFLARQSTLTTEYPSHVIDMAARRKSKLECQTETVSFTE